MIQLLNVAMDSNKHICTNVTFDSVGNMSINYTMVDLLTAISHQQV